MGRYTGLTIVEAPGAGVKIRFVEKGSPAQKCGLKQGDLLMKVNGEELQTKQEFGNMMDEAQVGDSFMLGIVRPSDLSNLNQTFRFIIEEELKADVISQAEVLRNTDASIRRLSVARAPEDRADENTIFDVLSNFHKTSKSRGAYWGEMFSEEDIKELSRWCVLFRFKPGDRVQLGPAQERLLFPIDKQKNLECIFSISASSTLGARKGSRRGGSRSSVGVKSRLRKSSSSARTEKLAVVIYGNPTDSLIHEKKNYHMLAQTGLQEAGPLTTAFHAQLQLSLPVCRVILPYSFF